MRLLTDEAYAQIVEALKPRRHHYCEDSWYSCPKNEDGCANPDEGNDCTCGADTHNELISVALATLQAAPEVEVVDAKDRAFIAIYEDKPLYATKEQK